MTRDQLQAQVLRAVREGGRVQPGELVTKVSAGTQASKGEVREALHDLVEKRAVGLNWHGEFEETPRTGG